MHSHDEMERWTKNRMKVEEIKGDSFFLFQLNLFSECTKSQISLLKLRFFWTICLLSDLLKHLLAMGKIRKTPIEGEERERFHVLQNLSWNHKKNVLVHYACIITTIFFLSSSMKFSLKEALMYHRYVTEIEINHA